MCSTFIPQITSILKPQPTILNVTNFYRYPTMVTLRALFIDIILGSQEAHAISPT